MRSDQKLRLRKPHPISPPRGTDAFVIDLPEEELSLDRTFASGQLFRWRQIGAGDWVGPLGESFVRLTRIGSGIRVSGVGSSISRDSVAGFLRLDTSLAQARACILDRDPSLAWVFERHPGLRVLRQPAVECLLSFVCSSATHIARIRWSVEELCRHFGTLGPAGHSFPLLPALASAEPERLRVGGMEFRCRNLSGAAKGVLRAGGEQFLAGLTTLAYEDAAAALISLPGVGRKIADCAMLFSLGFDCAFPLDTHTWRMVQQHCGIAPLPRTDRGYRVASSLLREKYGPFAGWLQQYLFLDSLNSPAVRRM